MFRLQLIGVLRSFAHDYKKGLVKRYQEMLSVMIRALPPKNEHSGEHQNCMDNCVIWSKVSLEFLSIF